MLKCFLSPRFLVTTALAATALALHAADAPGKKGVGYTDTPVIPGQKYKVHDADRPVPPVVTPGKTFSDAAPAPADAIVLFDGKDLSKWKDGMKDAAWKVENGYMEVTKGTISTREEFSDFQLHLEWAAPAVVKGDSQGRGNSGVIIFGKYEIQVLDSYNNPTYPDGQAGAMYGQWAPRVNSARPPGEWQTYDIIFEAPRWDAAKKLLKKANVTVIHNGVVLHHRQEFIGSVSHRGLGNYNTPQEKGPIVLQDHGNPMRFRNLWIRPLREYDQP
ncbi:MAG: hypothetical protein B9S33_04545 [Pedosphaera sp. Tous-C6FEB]|nr:MAG: hypothetical protein B9S33_04545 [Pedosphaera sp. Tous-C6FEB]